MSNVLFGELADELEKQELEVCLQMLIFCILFPIKFCFCSPLGAQRSIVVRFTFPAIEYIPLQFRLVSQFRVVSFLFGRWFLTGVR